MSDKPGVGISLFIENCIECESIMKLPGVTFPWKWLFDVKWALLGAHARLDYFRKERPTNTVNCCHIEECTRFVAKHSASVSFCCTRRLVHFVHHYLLGNFIILEKFLKECKE